MMARIARKKPTGYTLLEMLVYIVVFGAGLNLFISALNTGSRLSALTVLQLGRLEGVREIQNTYVSHVRRAAAIVPRAGDFESGENILVLRMPPNSRDGFDYVVLGAVRGPDLFSIVYLSEEKGIWSEPTGKTLRQPLGQLRFIVDEESGDPSVTLSLQVKQEDGERDKPFLTHESKAIPRGVLP